MDDDYGDDDDDDDESGNTNADDDDDPKEWENTYFKEGKELGLKNVIQPRQHHYIFITTLLSSIECNHHSQFL